MDFGSIKDQVSNLSLYDLKAGVRKVQNAVMNYTEMEAKVVLATTRLPSTRLISYSQLLNEIMPMIYKRFTEKSAEEWRQIYKSLQLLEFLIKNGSERVIDDARSHLSLLKMLRQFQFYDQNGKDQGINVRNRAKELADLLSDVDRIRSERKKARSNRNKFGGVEGGSAGFSGGIGGGIGSSSRYGGFGSEDASFGGHTQAVYGDGGGFGGQQSSFNDSGRRDRFEEYDEGDDVSDPTSSSRHTAATSISSSGRRKAPEQPKKRGPEVDLFEFGDDEPSAISAPQSATRASTVGEDDDFDDFISATPEPSITTAATSLSGIVPPPATTSVSASTQFAASKPVSASQNSNISGLASMTSMSPVPAQGTMPPMPSLASTPGTSAFTSPQPNYNPTTIPAPSIQSRSSFSSANTSTAQAQPQLQPQRPTGYQAAQPNYYTSVQAQKAAANNTGGAPKPGLTSTPSFGASKPATNAGKAGAGGGDAFSNLWSTASATAGIKKTGSSQGPNLASLAKEKTSAGIWGPSKPAGQPAAQQQRVQASQPPQQQQQQGGGLGGGLDDLLG
ncbi:Epsin-3, clathrin recruitment and traffic between the Golgi and endosome [Thelotrema lepadinum]|nr:Epsin-3, clathrin recruitment and traffic between the Golgi and endosome [Thelotrema lepadinum]